jgi:hypothetical protein
MGPLAGGIKKAGIKPNFEQHQFHAVEQQGGSDEFKKNCDPNGYYIYYICCISGSRSGRPAQQPSCPDDAREQYCFIG